jgi:hypothetical protein
VAISPGFRPAHESGQLARSELDERLKHREELVGFEGAQ